MIKKCSVSRVSIKPANGRRESLAVMSLSLIVMLLMASRFYWLGSHDQSLRLKPYQQLDNVLSFQQTALYRTLYASVFDIVAIRNEEGWWPEAALLKAEQIPPFESQLLPVNIQGYKWIGYDGGSWVDYLGSSDDAESTFILRLIDLHAGYHPHPHPGIDYDPELVVAVQIWYVAERGRVYPGERLAEAGWYWLMQKNDPLLHQAPLAASSMVRAFSG